MHYNEYYKMLVSVYINNNTQRIIMNIIIKKITVFSFLNYLFLIQNYII